MGLLASSIGLRSMNIGPTWTAGTMSRPRGTERALVSLRSMPWRPSRAAALAVFLVLASTAAGAQGRAKPSILLFPVHSHWLSEPLAEAATAALSDRLSQAGYRVTEVRPDSAMVQLAMAEGWVSAEALEGERLDGARQPLSVAIGATASLLGDVIEGEAEITLRLTISGAISQEEASVEVSVPRSLDRGAAAKGLADQVLAALTPDLWSQVGADGEGGRVAATARYAAGQGAMVEGMYREAVLDFDAALLGEPEKAGYLRAAAEAREALGDYSGAVVRMRSLASIAPSDAEVALQLGYAALRVGEAGEAEAAFLSAAEQLGDDPRVVEGLALAARAQGEPARAREYYEVLVGLLPGLAEEPPWLPGLLANAEETVELTGVPPDETRRELGRLYLDEGKVWEGIAALLAYHQEGDRPAYGETEYLGISEAVDGEAEAAARNAQDVFAAQALGELSDDEADRAMDSIHERSEALAALAERMEVSSLLDPAHRYRLLAYNLLNQSNFESLMYLRTRDAERQRRSDLLRSAFRKSLRQARLLAAALLGSEPED